MTISTTDNKVLYTAGGATVAFNFTFHTQNTDDISVYVDDVLDITPAVVLNADQETSPGGTVTFAVAPTALSIVSIVRIIDIDQQTDYLVGGDFPSESHEDALDKLTLVAQQLKSENSGALHFPVSEDVDPTLPVVASRKSSYLGFNAAGEPIAIAGAVSSVPVTTFMATVLDDADEEEATSTLKTLYTIENIAEARATLVIENGKLYFAKGTDGGLFKGVTGAPLLTYADNGGAYYGTQTIPTGGDGSIALVRIDGGYNVGLGYQVVWFGTVGDGVVDDRAAWILAMTAPPNGGVVKGNPEDVYYVSAAIPPVSNITVDLNGSTTTTNGAAGVTCFADTNVFTDLTFYDFDTTINYALGEDAVTLASSGDNVNFSVGDFIFMRCRGLASPVEILTPVGELNKVKAISGTTITLEYPITKDFIYDATYVYGIAVANSIVIENFHITGGKMIADGNRPIQLLPMWNHSITHCELEGIGCIVNRGRFITNEHNKLTVKPDWTTGFRPYYVAHDTGTSDFLMAHNECISTTGVGIVHIHEGVSNGLIFGNTLNQPVISTSPGVDELWGVISVLALSWNIKVAKNTIVNSPTRNMIYSVPHSVYTTEGSNGLVIDDNTLLGTAATFGIQVQKATNDTDVRITNNTVDIIANGANNYQLVAQGTGIQVLGNSIRTNDYLIEEGNILRGNVNIPDNNLVKLGVGDFDILSGTPALVSYRTSRGITYAFDAAADEIIAGSAKVPDYAKQADVYVWWTNLGAGAGDVVWSLNYNTFADGDDSDVADAGLAATVTAPAQDFIKRTSLGIATVVGGEFLSLRMSRTGTDVADTLGNDAGVMFIEISYR